MSNSSLKVTNIRLLKYNHIPIPKMTKIPKINFKKSNVFVRKQHDLHAYKLASIFYFIRFCTHRGKQSAENDKNAFTQKNHFTKKTESQVCTHVWCRWQ